MTFLTWWRGLSLGLFLIALATIVQMGLAWQWILVVMFAMSVVNALAKHRWRWAAHPAMWGAGLAWAYSTPPEGSPGHVGGWTMFLYLCGGSLVLSFLIGLVQKPEPSAPPPPRPGAGIVIDVEADRPGDGHRH